MARDFGLRIHTDWFHLWRAFDSSSTMTIAVDDNLSWYHIAVTTHSKTQRKEDHKSYRKRKRNQKETDLWQVAQVRLSSEIVWCGLVSIVAWEKSTACHLTPCIAPIRARKATRSNFCPAKRWAALQTKMQENLLLSEEVHKNCCLHQLHVRQRASIQLMSFVDCMSAVFICVILWHFPMVIMTEIDSSPLYVTLSQFWPKNGGHEWHIRESKSLIFSFPFKID